VAVVIAVVRIDDRAIVVFERTRIARRHTIAVGVATPLSTSGSS
jgi:hypothetical protein